MLFHQTGELVHGAGHKDGLVGINQPNGARQKLTVDALDRWFTGSINRSKDEGVSGHKCLGKGVEKFLCAAVAVGLKNSEKALRCAG